MTSALYETAYKQKIKNKKTNKITSKKTMYGNEYKKVRNLGKYWTQTNKKEEPVRYKRNHTIKFSHTHEQTLVRNETINDRKGKK